MAAIVESKWCIVVFDNRYCENVRRDMEPCDSFSQLIENNPAIAYKALDGHIHIDTKKREEIHYFIPFEYVYHNTGE